MATLLLDHVPSNLEVEQDDDGFLCSVPVCEFGPQPLILTLECRLSPLREYGRDAYEFSFSFIVSDLNGVEEAFTTQDRFIVRNYMGDLTAEFIMPTVCAALGLLAEEVHPSYIYRVTKGRNMPQKAYEKHHMVTASLYSLGFQTVETGTDGFGRTFWLMAR